MSCKDSVLPRDLFSLAVSVLVHRNPEVPLKHDQATATSYTWGEFDRTFVPIGHLKTDGSKVISIELGKE